MPVAPLPIDSWIDLPRFTALHGEATLLTRVAPLFRKQALGWLTAYEQACTEGDDAGVLLLLHKMKGSCAALCALALAADLEAAERTVRQRGVAESAEVLGSIHEAITRLNQALAPMDDTTSAPIAP